MSSLRRFLAWATTAGFLSVYALSCATSPTGRRQLILLPEGEVAALGATAFDELKAQEPLSKNQALNTYVQCIATAIIESNRDKVDGEWEVQTFESDQINAFALPGRKIGIYTGMAKFADNPDQLAAVMGHEVGHVLARHGNERMSSAMAAQGGLSLIGAWEGGGESKELLVAALGLGYDLGISRPHSRTQESEADEIGLFMMAKAGFDPSQAVLLWRKMAKNGGGGPEFLSTHPAPENRANALSGLQDKAQPKFAAARSAGKMPTCKKPRI